MPQAFWKHVSIRIPSPMLDAVSDFFTTLTGRGVSIREENSGNVIDVWLDPQNGEEHLLSIQRLIDALVLSGNLSKDTFILSREVPEEDWMSVFRSQHDTVQISSRLVIRPSWCDPVTPDDLVLDPGMAFGTGSHATTRMCLELLDSLLIKEPAECMLDLGTGSGILAIAGAHLGLSKILAVDIDPVAVEAAVRNVTDNHFGSMIRVVEGGIEMACGTFDIITANLSSSALKNLSEQLTNHLSPGGHLIVSGIMTEEMEEVFTAFILCGLKPFRTMADETWAASILKHSS